MKIKKLIYLAKSKLIIKHWALPNACLLITFLAVFTQKKIASEKIKTLLILVFWFDFSIVQFLTNFHVTIKCCS